MVSRKPLAAASWARAGQLPGSGPSQRRTSSSRCAMGLGRVSCSRRETAGHRCCSRGGQAGPGRTAAHQGWSVLGAAEDDEANWPWTCLTPAEPPCPHVPARSGVGLGCGAPLLPTGLAPEPLSARGSSPCRGSSVTRNHSCQVAQGQHWTCSAHLKWAPGP